MPTWVWAAIATVAVIALVVTAVAATMATSAPRATGSPQAPVAAASHTPSTVAMPNYRGWTLQNAINDLNSVGLGLTMNNAANANQLVISQSPAAGTQISATTTGIQLYTNTTPSSAPAAPAAPAPAAPPKVYSGKGDDVLKIDKPSGPAILTFSCAKCSGNTIVQSDGADSLLVNTIGSYSGKRAIDLTDGSTTSELTIKATGAWKVTVGGLDQATQATGTAPVTGKGDDVIVLSRDTATAAITNHGDANFIVQATPAVGGFPDLAVNTIGSYTGTVPLAAPAVVQVTSDGNWSITPGS